MHITDCYAHTLAHILSEFIVFMIAYYFGCGLFCILYLIEIQYITKLTYSIQEAVRAMCTKTKSLCDKVLDSDGIQSGPKSSTINNCGSKYKWLVFVSLFPFTLSTLKVLQMRRRLGSILEYGFRFSPETILKRVTTDEL